MKRLALTLALLAGLSLAGVADAQDRERGRNLRGATETRDSSGQIIRDGKPLTPEQAKAAGMAEAPAVITRAGITCTMTDATATASGKVTVDGAQIDVKTYEVACSEGLGYFLQDRGATAVAFDCIQVAANAAATPAAAPAATPARRGAPAAPPPAAAPTCKLPGNQNANAMIQPVVAAAGARCTVTNVSFMGFSPANNLRRYEVACSEGMGYVVDRLPTGAPKAVDCLTAGMGGQACTLTTKEQINAYIGSIASRSGRTCTIADTRIMGSSASGSTYYELACAGSPGYVMETKAGAFVRALDCLEAVSIGGGCTLTNTAAIAEVREGQYLAALRSKGIPCTGTEFRLLGKDSRQRDVVEFICSDRPSGLVAFVAPGGAGDITNFDCFEAEGRSIACQINKKENLMAVIQRSLAGKSECQVRNFKVLGASATDGLVVEVACAAPVTGFIVDLPENRGPVNSIQTCAQSAARGGERCALPENRG